MIIQKSKVKKFVNEAGFKMSRDPAMLDALNRLVVHVLERVLTTAADDGMKTVQPKHAAYQEPKPVNTASTAGDNAHANIKPQFLEWARVVQGYCVEQAVILSKDV